MESIITIWYYQSGALIMLPATSERFTAKGWVPAVGSRIVVQRADQSHIVDGPGKAVVTQQGPLSQELGSELPADFAKMVLTVTECIYDYHLSDVGIFCEYRPF